MNKFEHIMIDIETLGYRSTSVIISIAATKFNLDDDNTEDFFVNLNPKGMTEKGLTIDQSTIDWWKNQKPEVLKQSLKDSIDYKTALEKFVDFCSDMQYKKFWCNGASFDFPIIENSLHVFGMSDPWKYYNLADLRTVLYIADFNTKNAKRIGSYHNALDDVKTQISWLKAALS